MLDLDQLRWTSRDDVCALLLDAVQRGDARLVTEAARLLAFLCPAARPAALAPPLLALARDRGRPFWVRTYALRGLARAGAELPLDALRDLLDEQPPAVQGGLITCDLPMPTAPPMLEVLRLCRAPDQQRLALGRLARMTPEAQRSLLHECVTIIDPPPLAITSWLHERWMDRVRRGQEAGAEIAEEDLWVARDASSVFPESTALLLDHLRARGVRGEELWQEIHQNPDLAALLDEDAAARVEGAKALVLPLPALVEALGTKGLRVELKAAILDLSFHRRCPVGRPAWPLERRAAAARRAIAAWSEGPAVALGLLRDAVLHPEVRADLVVALLAGDRAAARQLLEARLGEADDLEALRAALREIQRAPSAEDGPFLRVVARGVDDAEAQHRALDALEELSEDGEDGEEWPGVLQGLAAGAAPLPRLRALGALARRGGGGAARALVEAATEGAEVLVRAEAIRRLGELPGAATHLDLFERALRCDHAAQGPEDLPAADQAALALACAGGPAARSGLLRGYFAAESTMTVDIIEDLLLFLDDAPEEGESPRARRARILADARLSAASWAARWSPFSARASLLPDL